MDKKNITKNLKDKYNLEFSDMTLLEIDDDDHWVICKNTMYSRLTDDGAEHYMHSNGKHYTLDYTFNIGEWNEYIEYSKTNENKCIIS
jgi:hypothetical protein